MPALEMAQETGKVLSWRKKEGDHVTKGEPLLEIETDKAVVEIESPGDGILAGIRAREGAVVPVGQTIAWLVQPGETPPAENAPAASSKTPASHRPLKRRRAEQPQALPASRRLRPPGCRPRPGGWRANREWIWAAFEVPVPPEKFWRRTCWRPRRRPIPRRRGRHRNSHPGRPAHG